MIDPLWEYIEELDEAQTDAILREHGYDPELVGVEMAAFAHGCMERYRHLWVDTEATDDE